MRICRKCQKEFNIMVVIEGKKRNLGNRKFCLDCSPFGKHNTKPDDPSRKSVYGQKDGKKLSYAIWDEHVKESLRKSNKIREKKLKQRAIYQKGGKCLCCGYNKTISALTFHHIERSSKEFNLQSDILRSKPWDTVQKELEKCELLCLNCHMEKEAEYDHKEQRTMQHTRGLKRKSMIVHSLGGKCSVCGYDKCLRCLSFHHKEPALKEFPLDIRSFNGYSWKRLEKEVAKCEIGRAHV